MLKSEFETMVQEYKEVEDYHISDELYKTIEYVYTWHPAISDTVGKRQIVHLYCEFGYEFIKKMVPAAEEMDQIDTEIRDLEIQISQIRADRKRKLEEWGN